MGDCTILLMRHGPAADESVTGLDDDRILTAAGRGRVERMAEALISLGGRGAIPSSVVTSPLARASETSMLLLRVLRKHGHDVPLHVAKELAPGRLTVASAAALCARHQGITCMVGHEPCLSSFVAAAARAHLPRGMDKAMIVALSGTLPAMTLAWVLDPTEHGG